MAIALLIHFGAFALAAILGGELFYLGVSGGNASSKVMRWVGVISYTLITGVFVVRFLSDRGVTPASIGVTGIPGYALAWVGVALLGGLAAIAGLRLVRFTTDLVYYRRIVRTKTLLEMDARDALHEDSFAGVTCRATEGMVDDLCKDRAGEEFGVRFEFLLGQRQPSTMGFLDPGVACGLDMAWGRGGDLLEIAVIREVELHRLKVRFWRALLLPLVIINPFGTRFAQGILLTLDFEADDVTRGLGPDEAAGLVDLLHYLKDSSEHTGGAALDGGPKALLARLARIEGERRSSFFSSSKAVIPGVALLVAGFAGSASKLGPLNPSVIRGLVLLDPPGYITVTGPSESEARSILGKGWSDPNEGDRTLADGVYVDAKKVENGLTLVSFSAWKMPEIPLVASVEVTKRDGVVPASPDGPWLVNTYMHMDRHNGIVLRASMDYLKGYLLKEGKGQIYIPNPPDEAPYSLSSFIAIPPGWAVRVTGWRRCTEPLPGPQDPAEARAEYSTLKALEDRYKTKEDTLPLPQMLAWDTLVATSKEHR